MSTRGGPGVATRHRRLRACAATIRRAKIHDVTDDPNNADLLELARTRGVQSALQLLVGLPLRGLGRCATLLWVHFGDLRWVATSAVVIRALGAARAGPGRDVGEFALHTEAPWRLRGPEGIVTGRGDIFATPDGTWSTTACDSVGGTLFDERLKALGESLEDGSRIVRTTTVDPVGTLVLTLSGGLVFEVFPEESYSTEQWRFFRPASDDPHVVVTAQGLE